MKASLGGIVILLQLEGEEPYPASYEKVTMPDRVESRLEKMMPGVELNNWDGPLINGIVAFTFDLTGYKSSLSMFTIITLLENIVLGALNEYHRDVGYRA